MLQINIFLYTQNDKSDKAVKKENYGRVKNNYLEISLTKQQPIIYLIKHFGEQFGNIYQQQPKI